MLFLHGHGVSTSKAVRIYKTYGDQAIGKVKNTATAFFFVVSRWSPDLDCGDTAPWGVPLKGAPLLPPQKAEIFRRKRKRQATPWSRSGRGGRMVTRAVSILPSQL